MKFCTRCDQEQIGENRFCTICGTELTDPAASDVAEATQTYQIKRTPAAPPAPSYEETQYAGPPMASWEQPPAWGQPAAPGPDSSATRTVYPGLSAAGPPPPQQPAPDYLVPGFHDQPGGYQQPAGYQQPGQFSPPDWPGPGTSGFPAAPGPGPGRSGQGRTMALVAGAIVVVVAAGAGAFALVSSLHKSGSTNASSSSPAGNTSSSVIATSPPGSGSSTPAPTPTTVSPTPKPTPTGIVAFAAGVSGSPYAAQVENLFTRYFTGINTHSYSEYASALDAGMRANNPQSSFASGYATTTDSNETVNSITSTGSGLTAVVTFTARQSPSDSPDNSACNNYTLTLPLVPQGSGYVITTPPSGYASYSDC
jgi:hypothetical protein